MSTSTPFPLSYNQQQQSSEMFSFSPSSHFSFNEFGLGTTSESPPYSRTSSFSSISSDERSISSGDEDESEADENITTEEGSPNWRKRFERICEKLDLRDRCYEVEHLLRRKSLQLSSQTSLPLDLHHHFWNRNPTTMTSTTATTATNTLRRNSRSEFTTMTTRRPSLSQMDLHPKSLLQIAKELRSNCDKILDRTVPFLIDSSLLWTISEAVNQVTTNRVPPQDTTQDYEDQVLFLSDFFEQTPSLAIVLSDTPPTLPGGSLDLTLFRALEFLELRKVPPHFVSGLNTLRAKLRRLKCSRNIESIEQVFNAPCCAEILSSARKSLNPVSSPALTSVWPELKEIDVSFNRLAKLDTSSLECMPGLEILNVSRNRITTVDSNFSRILQTLTVLNLNFNQLTCVPPTPPNLKILLLSNNFIPTLLSRHPLPQSLEMLDLSQNVISDEREIEPLRTLSGLRTLAFNGNPITYSGRYRRTVAAHLSRNVVKVKGFLLDQKKLSTSEVRFALETKRPIPPMNPPSFLMGSSRSTTSPGKTVTKDRLGDLRSLTDSIDSSSSSLRSACRKKARIREVVILDDDDEVPSPPIRKEAAAESVKASSSGSSSSSSIAEVPTSEEIIKATGEALQSIRTKYGEEFWLFRQAGQDVSNLLHINQRQPSSPPKKTLSFSRSAPLTTSSSFYSALSEWELSTTSKPPKPDSPSDNTSDESIKPVSELNELQDENESVNSSGDGLLFYSCQDNSGSSSSPDSSLGGEETFKDPAGRAHYFRTYENGALFQLVILDNFLYHVDPSKGNAVTKKWDLKSLKSVREDKRIQETETVQFELSFDTCKRSHREKSCVMPLKDFKLFHEETTVYLQVRTLQEFGEGFQCAKCQWEFSKGIANTVLKVKGGRAPEEVPVCPNPACQSELLIPLDGVALDPPQQLQWEPMLSSTPILPGGFLSGKSLPTESGLRDPRRPSSSSFLDIPKSTTSANTPTNSATSNKIIKDPKSESDIETLSCDDSSSIEILPKTGSSSGGEVEGDSGSDVAVLVEEGLEVDIPPLHTTTNPPHKNLEVPVMTDSTSSGSCTGSICTQYEKTITASSHPLQLLISPLSMLTQSSISSAPPPILTQPIKYDYENFGATDHRLLLHCDLHLFKHPEERLLALAKVMVMTTTFGPSPALVIFSNKKIYFCKITGPETDKVESWLVNWKNFPFSRLSKMEVLIGRHSLGIDFSGKYFALIFRDSARTSNFIEFFLCDVCGEIPWTEDPPFVQDFSQTQKALMSPTNPISYFGILRHAYCASGHGIDKSYTVSAVVVTNEELILVADLSWLVNRTSDSVAVKHVRELVKLRQVESFEVDPSFVRLVFQLDSVMLKWELAFETESEKGIFLGALRSEVKEVPFISLSEPGLA